MNAHDGARGKQDDLFPYRATFLVSYAMYFIEDNSGLKLIP